jgi:beta-phosphoglucomutase
MPFKAVIFDFNGTLFNDTDFHNQAWRKFAEYHGKILSDEVIEQNIHGFTNREILDFIFERELSPEEHALFYEEKESLYREILYMHPERCMLAPGAEEFLDILIAKKIPITIATASYRPNVEIYFSLFNLHRWFQFDKIVFDTGEFRGKPFPDLFLEASRKIDIPISACMIIEDSLGGVNAAKNAGAAIIIAISSDNNPGKFSQLNFIDQIITDFRQLDLMHKL